MTAPTATLSDRLEELARRVEALSGPCREIDAEIARLCGFGLVAQEWHYGKLIWYAWKAEARSGPWEVLNLYTKSIDAAMTLVPEGYCVSAMGEVPDDMDWYVNLWRDGDDEGEPEVRAKTAPLAICSAALRALATLQGGEG